jgi:hypothetical protein
VLRTQSSTGKRIFLKKSRKLRPQGQGRPPGAWNILTEPVAISKFLEPDFDLGPAIHISSECGQESPVDLF